MQTVEDSDVYADLSLPHANTQNDTFSCTELQNDKMNKVTELCEDSDPDQPGHLLSPIRVFAMHLKGS